MGHWQCKKCSCRRETEGHKRGTETEGHKNKESTPTGGEVQKSARDHICEAAQTRVRPGKRAGLLSTGLVWLSGLLKACGGLSSVSSGVYWGLTGAECVEKMWRQTSVSHLDVER